MSTTGERRTGQSHLNLALALCALFNAPLQGDDRSISAQELCARLPHAGQEVLVTGKYRGLVDSDLFLDGCDIAIVLHERAHFELLLKCEPNKDNLRIRGRATTDIPPRIRVEEISKAASDYDLLRDALESASRRTSDAQTMLNVGKQAVDGATKTGAPELRELAYEAFDLAIERAAKTASGDALTAQLEIVARANAIAQNPAYSRDKLVALLKQHPERQEIVAAIEGLGCRQYAGRWLTKEERNRAEGFKMVDGVWLTPREAAMTEAQQRLSPRLTASSLLLLRRRTDKEYVLMAEQKRVEEGMRREEVCMALGFPNYVVRDLHDQKEFDQWWYPHGYFYFYDGLLIETPERR